MRFSPSRFSIIITSRGGQSVESALIALAAIFLAHSAFFF